MMLQNLSNFFLLLIRSTKRKRTLKTNQPSSSDLFSSIMSLIVNQMEHKNNYWPILYANLLYSPSKKRTHDDRIESGNGSMHPSTLRVYLCYLQRVLRKKGGIAVLQLLKIRGIMIVFENKILDQQRLGRVIESHRSFQWKT